MHIVGEIAPVGINFLSNIFRAPLFPLSRGFERISIIVESLSNFTAYFYSEKSSCMLIGLRYLPGRRRKRWETFPFILYNQIGSDYT